MNIKISIGIDIYVLNWIGMEKKWIVHLIIYLFF